MRSRGNILEKKASLSQQLNQELCSWILLSWIRSLGQSDPITRSRKIKNTNILTPIKVLPGGEVNSIQTKGLSVGNGYFPKKIMSALLLEECCIRGSHNKGLTTDISQKSDETLSIFLGKKLMYKHKTKTKYRDYTRNQRSQRHHETRPQNPVTVIKYLL